MDPRPADRPGRHPLGQSLQLRSGRRQRHHADISFNPKPITFEQTVSVSGYNDITPRVGFAYDLFGNGKTALKVHVGKYVQAATADSIYSSNNPAARIVTRIGVPASPRSWTDGNQQQASWIAIC